MDQGPLANLVPGGFAPPPVDDAVSGLALLVCAPTALALLLAWQDLARLLRSTVLGLLWLLACAGQGSKAASVPPGLMAQAEELLARGRRTFAAGAQLVWVLLVLAHLAKWFWFGRDCLEPCSHAVDAFFGECRRSPMLQVYLYIGLLASLLLLRHCSSRSTHVWAVLPHTVHLAVAVAFDSAMGRGVEDEVMWLPQRVASDLLVRVVLGSYTSCRAAVAYGAVHSAVLVANRRAAGKSDRLTEEVALGAGALLVLGLAERLIMQALILMLRTRELEKSHAALAGMLEAFCTSVVQLDPDQRISGSANELAALLSRPAGESLAGCSFCELLASEDERDKLRESLDATAGQRVRELQVRLLDSSSPPAQVRARLHCASFEGAGGKRQYLLGLRAQRPLSSSTGSMQTRADAEALVSRLLPGDRLLVADLPDSLSASDDEECDGGEEALSAQIAVSDPLEVMGASAAFEAIFGRPKLGAGFVEWLARDADRDALVRWLGARASDTLEGRSPPCVRHFGPVSLRPQPPHGCASEPVTAVLAISLPDPCDFDLEGYMVQVTVQLLASSGRSRRRGLWQHKIRQDKLDLWQQSLRPPPDFGGAAASPPQDPVQRSASSAPSRGVAEPQPPTQPPAEDGGEAPAPGLVLARGSPSQQAAASAPRELSPGEAFELVPDTSEDTTGSRSEPSLAD
mmetsp:Transcript_1767/g.4728  ORF Transcript_1767/g.4728 Transcript_1767/m.4728 type:complete len:687 (-) Transcript_1767:53-2113(-)